MGWKTLDSAGRIRKRNSPQITSEKPVLHFLGRLRKPFRTAILIQGGRVAYSKEAESGDRNAMTTRTFQPGDELVQVSIYNEASADLPKFKAATLEDVRRRRQAPDFDPTAR